MTTIHTALTVGETAIRQHDGLYSLNDLHKASGGDDKHQPSFFLRNEQAKALIEEIQSANLQSAIATVNGGKHRGTYACREIVIAYAAWISPAFQLKVIRVFLDTATSPVQALPPPVPTKTLTFTVPVNDRNSRWLLHTDRTGREIVTELSPETLITTIDELTQRLMVSPADLNMTLSQMLTITHACLNNMRTSAAMYANKLNIQPAKPPPQGTRRQLAAMGISSQ